MMKKMIKRYPFITSLLFSGIAILLIFALSKLEGTKWFAGNVVSASVADITGTGGTSDPAVADETVSQGPADGAETGAQTGQNAQEPLPEDTSAKTPDREEYGQAKEQQKPRDESKRTKQFLAQADADENAGGMAKAEDDPAIGTTDFIYYDPVEVNSRYYEDPGRRPMTTNYRYSTVGKEYFDDAVFIGDSRMVGLFDYGGFDGADFFCDNGFCVYNWQKRGEVKFQNEHKNVNLMEALSEKRYGKVYLMIGMNDCGYGNSETFRQGLDEMLAAIEERQPDAVLYLMANMYITQEKEEAIFNNVHINAKNVILAECADGKRIFYLEYNDLYQDENGCLKSDLTFDGFHLYGTQYAPWIDFLMSHAVVKGE